MQHHFIHELLLEEDLSSKHELVEIFKKRFEERKSSSDLKSLLSSYLIGDSSGQRRTNVDLVRMHGPRTGLANFVANQLYLSASVESIENRLSVLDELKIVLNSLHFSNNPILKVSKAKGLINLLQTFLGEHFRRIIYQRHLSIFFIPFESKIVNAAYDNNTNSIAVFRTKNKEQQTPEYVFLHEFGHALHCRLFKTIDNVPKSFLDLSLHFNDDFFTYSKEDQLEIYADFFSIAVMLDSNFEKSNPLIKTMSRIHCEKVKHYFITEISNLN